MHKAPMLPLPLRYHLNSVCTTETSITQSICILASFSGLHAAFSVSDEKLGVGLEFSCAIVNCEAQHAEMLQKTVN